MCELFPVYCEKLKILSSMLVEESLNYARDTGSHLLVAACIYLSLCVAAYFTTAYLKALAAYGHLKAVKRVLLVTAHPDDECMFFGPTIVKLARRAECQLFLLCLSQGDYRNLGRQRRRELWASCKVLGIPDSHVTLCINDYLPDDPGVRWREDVAAALILDHAESLGVDTIVTFDKLGVSRHSNHSSVFYAVAYLCMEKKLPSHCKAYTLETINVLRKYSGPLDVPISFLMSSFWFVDSLRERASIKAAMAAHRSQYVWFRKLYMIFSRYTFVNTLREIECVDLELDLELDD
ncbi:N-acetylglucosaminyl-phosphatidylinositol de-N-acetylase [Bacillus rossius redtenbacheri]|uniref:N-acetylglucosaminyl-phosphatidylinositol de-N-acetylase n=1 Tax=Bacillus rossius redtenbacheri TaxID=93214 RepID=UPI002FDD3CE6